MYMNFKQWLWRTLIDNGDISPTVSFTDLTPAWLDKNLSIGNKEIEDYKLMYRQDCTAYGNGVVPEF